MRRVVTWIGVIALVGLLILGVVLSATQDPYVLVFYLSYASVGLALIIRRPRNFLGWLLFFLAFGFITVGSSFAVDVKGLEDGTAPATSYLVVWTSTWVSGLVFTAYVALAVLFPTGRLPEGPWRWPAFALVAVGLVLALLSALAPTLSYDPSNSAGSISVDNPFAILPGSAFWDVATVDSLTVASILMLAVAAIGMIARHRRATGLIRLQMRWLVAAVAAVVASIVIGLVILAIAGEGADYAWIPAMIAYPLVPLAIGRFHRFAHRSIASLATC